MSKGMIILMIIAVFFGILLWYSGGSRIKDEMPYYVKQLIKETGTVTVRSAIIQVELAKTPQAQTNGLSGRSYLDQNKGMLFVFQQPGQYAFTMQKTSISLDIIWINSGKIVFIVNRAEPGNANINPSVTADYVLEVNGGTASAGGWQVGDPVAITFDKK